MTATGQKSKLKRIGTNLFYWLLFYASFDSSISCKKKTTILYI